MPQDRLLSSLQRAHDGKPWHGPSRAAVLADVTVAEAAWRPAPDAHSMWEIVLHMRGWTLEVLRRVRGGVPSEPQDGDWPPESTPASATAWRETLASLDAAHAALVAQVAAMDDAELGGRVRDRLGDPPGSAITQRAMVRSLAEHDVYHTGQLAMLKRLVRAAVNSRHDSTGAAQ